MNSVEGGRHGWQDGALRRLRDGGQPHQMLFAVHPHDCDQYGGRADRNDIEQPDPLLRGVPAGFHPPDLTTSKMAARPKPAVTRGRRTLQAIKGASASSVSGTTLVGSTRSNTVITATHAVAKSATAALARSPATRSV